MDCQGNFLPTVIEAPTVLAIKDERHHMVSHTIVDYDQVDEILSKIKKLCERNHWHHEITVLPSEKYFMSELTMKDVVKDVK